MRTVNVKDGYAMQYAVKQGYTLAVISGGASEAMTQRFHQLGAKHVYMRVSDKAAQLDILCQEAGITPDQIAYIGDDIPDIPIMKPRGLCPALLRMPLPKSSPSLPTSPSVMGAMVWCVTSSSRPCVPMASGRSQQALAGKETYKLCGSTSTTTRSSRLTVSTPCGAPAWAGSSL